MKLILVAAVAVLLAAALAVSSGRAAAAASARPLTGIVVGIDPGHNSRNADDPAYIDRLIWNGREWRPAIPRRPTSRS